MSDNIKANIEKSVAVAIGKDSCNLAGAVIAYENKVVYSCASKILNEDDPTAHAAVFAIRKTRLKMHRFLLKGYIVYLSEKPCNMCLLAMYQAGINNVYYLEKEKIKHMFLTEKTLKKAYAFWEFN
ncbi:MAG: deaminase [Bacteroidales bacterium]|jgi:tRNA(Arg) A34 adenosine deaminase TadA|nr:deaminase [Bacteroidales bacterium]